MGFCEDKDFSKMLAQMPSDAHYIFTQASIRRAASTEKIAEIAEMLHLDYELLPTIPEALTKAQSLLTEEDMLFIGGSTFVVAEVLPLFN
jgi:dihydrofolate synthase/folylpolyglutamate synthase